MIVIAALDKVGMGHLEGLYGTKQNQNFKTSVYNVYNISLYIMLDKLCLVNVRHNIHKHSIWIPLEKTRYGTSNVKDRSCFKDYIFVNGSKSIQKKLLNRKMWDINTILVVPYVK